MQLEKIKKVWGKASKKKKVELYKEVDAKIKELTATKAHIRKQILEESEKNKWTEGDKNRFKMFGGMKLLEVVSSRFNKSEFMKRADVKDIKKYEEITTDPAYLKTVQQIKFY